MGIRTIHNSQFIIHNYAKPISLPFRGGSGRGFKPDTTMLQANDYKVIDCGSEVRRMYEFNGRTPRGERVIVEVSECYPFSAKGWGKNDLPTLWAKKGWTDGVLPNYLSIHTYVYSPGETCWIGYNPQTRKAWDGERDVINFDWILPVSDENRNRLLAEVVRRANAGEPTPVESLKKMFNG